MANIRAVVKPLLKPHLDDLEKKIAPGMYSLTWTSMNIDGYLHRAEQAIARFDELVRKINDLVDNRVEANLKCISRTVLVDLPPDRCDGFTVFSTEYIYIYVWSYMNLLVSF